MEILSVGEKVPDPYFSYVKKNREGCVLTQTKEGFWTMVVFIPNTKEDEINTCRKNNIFSRYIVDKTNTIVLSLMRVENTPLIFEIGFDPTLYPESEWKQRQEGYYKDNVITFLLVDSLTGIIKVIRRFNMPIKMREIWLKAWNKAYTIENYSQLYKNWTNRIQNNHSVIQLWNDGIAGGMYGESGEITQTSFNLSKTIPLENGKIIEDKNNEIIKKASLEGYVNTNKKYHSSLPKELEKFYCYTHDGGHSIIVVLKNIYKKGDKTEDHAVPAPVKQVLREGYKIKDGWVWCSLPYDKEYGLESKDDDHEY